jgi:hypothetical protein
MTTVAQTVAALGTTITGLCTLTVIIPFLCVLEIFNVS